jgi:sigma-E factor negative regulatory protein RseA
MDDRKKESISALMDDEANEIELQRLLSKEDPEALLKTWSRYHLMRDVLNGHAGLNIQVDVSDAVRDEIEQHDMYAEDSDGGSAQPETHTLTEVGKGELGKSQLDTSASLDSSNKVSNLHASDSAYSGAEMDQVSLGLGLEGALDDVSENSAEETMVSQSSRRVFKYSSFAVAACLMLAVFLSLNFEEAVQGDQYASSGSLSGGLSDGLSEGLVVNVLTSAQSANFNEYLLRHSERSAVRTNYSMAPLVRVASVNSVGI